MDTLAIPSLIVTQNHVSYFLVLCFTLIDGSLCNLTKYYLILALPSGPSDPCQPSPCGPNSICVSSGEMPACSCQPSFIGTAPNCRPECTISAECPAALACVAQRCKDPCLQACGPRAICSVIDHRATCACESGLEGNPFQGCSQPKGKP